MKKLIFSLTPFIVFEGFVFLGLFWARVIFFCLHADHLKYPDLIIGKIFARGMLMDGMMLTYTFALVFLTVSVGYFIWPRALQPIKKGMRLWVSGCAVLMFTLEIFDQYLYFKFDKGIYVFLFPNEKVLAQIHPGVGIFIILAIAVVGFFYFFKKLLRTQFLRHISVSIGAFLTNDLTCFFCILCLTIIGARGAVGPLPVTEMPQVVPERHVNRMCINAGYIVTWALERKMGGMGVSPKLDSY